MTRFPWAAGLALAASAAPVAHASEFVPGGNAGALARVFALPALGDGHVVEVGREETRVTLDFSNEYVHEGFNAAGACPGECVNLDGETSRLRLNYRRGLARGWDLAIDASMLRERGGFLDRSIEQWHDWFRLPNGGREFAVRNQYRYFYERGGMTLLDVTEGGSCLGDVGIGLGTQLSRNTALRGLAKIATGNDHPLCGGNAGYAVWLDMLLPMSGGAAGYLAAGYSLNERSDVLPDLQNREVWFGGLGLLLPLGGSTRLHAQVQGHTRLYDGSTLTPFACPGVPLTLGLQFGREGHFEIGFQEDPSVNASPDFVLYVSVLGSN